MVDSSFASITPPQTFSCVSYRLLIQPFATLKNRNQIKKNRTQRLIISVNMEWNGSVRNLSFSAGSGKK